MKRKLIWLVVIGLYVLGVLLLVWLTYQKYAVYPDLTPQRLTFIFWPHDLVVFLSLFIGRLIQAIYLD